MSLPVTARYFFKFRFSDTGLTPSFLFYKDASSLSNVTQPSISELSGGVYYFDRVISSMSDPEIVFQIDGGSGLPDSIRYVSDSIHPNEFASESINDYLVKAVGLLHENSVMDQTSYSSGKLTGARIRLYDSKANALLASSTGKLYEYQVAATYSGGNLTSYTVTRTYPA